MLHRLFNKLLMSFDTSLRVQHPSEVNCFVGHGFTLSREFARTSFHTNNLGTLS